MFAFALSILIYDVLQVIRGGTGGWLPDEVRCLGTKYGLEEDGGPLSLSSGEARLQRFVHELQKRIRQEQAKALRMKEGCVNLQVSFSSSQEDHAELWKSIRGR